MIHRAARQLRRTRKRLAVVALAAASGTALVVLLVPSTAFAVQCGVKLSPPYGTGYGSINVPSAPGTYHAYYSFWSSWSNYYARRIRPDSTIAYEAHYNDSGDYHDFSNSVDVDRRTQMQNADGVGGWNYWVQANSMTSC